MRVFYGNADFDQLVKTAKRGYARRSDDRCNWRFWVIRTEGGFYKAKEHAPPRDHEVVALYIRSKDWWSARHKWHRIEGQEMADYLEARRAEMGY